MKIIYSCKIDDVGCGETGTEFVCLRHYTVCMQMLDKMKDMAI